MKKFENEKFDDLFVIKSKIARVIKKKRALENLTIKELSRQLDVTQSSLFRFENAVGNPRWSLFKKVVAGLGLHLVVK